MTELCNNVAKATTIYYTNAAGGIVSQSIQPQTVQPQASTSGVITTQNTYVQGGTVVRNAIPVVRNTIPIIRGPIPRGAIPIARGQIPIVRGRLPIVRSTIPILQNRLPIVQNAIPVSQSTLSMVQTGRQNTTVQPVVQTIRPMTQTATVIQNTSQTSQHNTVQQLPVQNRIVPVPQGFPQQSSIQAVQSVKTENGAVVAEDQPTIDIVISNVVCSFSTRCHLNLKRIAMEGSHVVYKRENGMVNMKLRRPSCTATIWSSGKITCTGATSNEDSKRGARRIARNLQRIGFRARFTNYRIVNVLGTCTFPFGIRITHFSNDHKENASYEPEIHPGVTYKIKTPKATLKIFSTGSVTVTAPSIDNVQQAIEHIFPLVHQYQMERLKPTPKPEPVRLHYMPKYRNSMQRKRDFSQYVVSDESEEEEEEEFGIREEYCSDDYDSEEC